MNDDSHDGRIPEVWARMCAAIVATLEPDLKVSPGVAGTIACEADTLTQEWAARFGTEAETIIAEECLKIGKDRKRVGQPLTPPEKDAR